MSDEFNKTRDRLDTLLEQAEADIAKKKDGIANSKHEEASKLWAALDKIKEDKLEERIVLRLKWFLESLAEDIAEVKAKKEKKKTKG